MRAENGRYRAGYRHRRRVGRWPGSWWPRGWRRAGRRPPVLLRVDPTRCDGIGMCGHLAGELVRLDSWGFPIPADHPLSAAERRRAASAVRGCPRQALFLDSVAEDPIRVGPPRT